MRTGDSCRVETPIKTRELAQASLANCSSSSGRHRFRSHSERLRQPLLTDLPLLIERSAITKTFRKTPRASQSFGSRPVFFAKMYPAIPQIALVTTMTNQRSSIIRPISHSYRVQILRQQKRVPTVSPYAHQAHAFNLSITLLQTRQSRSEPCQPRSSMIHLLNSQRQLYQSFGLHKWSGDQDSNT